MESNKTQMQMINYVNNISKVIWLLKNKKYSTYLQMNKLKSFRSNCVVFDILCIDYYNICIVM